MDNSSHNHILNHIRSIPTSWLQESWVPLNHRHERIAVGALSLGIAVMTQEMVEMHVHQAPDVRGMMDYLPVHRPLEFGVRQKLGTWPLSKNDMRWKGIGTHS